MSNNAMMRSEDDLSAHCAECFVTIDGRRYSMLMAKDFEGKAKVKTREVPRLGNIVVGHKAETAVLSFSMTIYKCTEIFDDVIERFIRAGVMPRFTIQTSNDDQASTVGRSTKIYHDCVLDGDVLLSVFHSEGGSIEQEITGFCDSFSRPEKYVNPSYM